MKTLPKVLFLVLIGFSALAVPASAAPIDTSSVTIQTPLVPIELFIISIALTIGLICFAITRKDHSAIWISVLSVLSGAFTLGCSFAFGQAVTTINGTAAITTLTAITNIGCTLFSLGLLIFAVIMLLVSIFTVWQAEANNAKII